MSRGRVLWLLGAAALAACGSGAALPAGVDLRIYQTRSDQPLGLIEIQVRNGAAEPLTVRRAELSSAALTGIAVWDRPTVVPAGATVDLKVAIPAAVCPRADHPPSVRLDYSVSGREGTAQVAAPDPLGQFAGNLEQQCRERAVHEAVTIVPPTRLLRARDRAVLTYRFEPAGGGPARVVSAHPTVLLSTLDDSGNPVDPLPLDVAVTDAPQTVRIRVAPARCDPHVIAEDKQGTYVGFTVATAAGTSRIPVGVEPAVRAQLHRFVADRCRLTVP